MVQYNNFYDEVLDQVTHTGDTNYFDTGCTILGLALLANTNYLIVAVARLARDSTSGTAFMRVTTADDTAIETKSDMRIEMNTATTTNRGNFYVFIHSFQTDASPADIKIQIRTSSGSQTVAGDQMAIGLLDLDDFGSGNYVETINADDNSAYPTTQAVEWTIPGSSLGTEEWVVLAYQRTHVNNAGRNYRVEAHAAADTATSAVRARDENEGEDTAETRMSGFALRHKASSGTPDFEMQTFHESGGTQHADAGGYGIALKTSAFADFQFAYVAASTTLDGTERTFGTITSYSPSATAEHWLFGLFDMINAGTADNVETHIEDDGAEMRVGDEPMLDQSVYDTTAQMHTGVFHRDNILSSDTSTYTLRGKTGTGANDAEHRWLILLSLEKSSAGQTIAIGTLAETDALVAIPAVKPIITPVGVLAETDALISAGPIKVAPVGTLPETENLVGVQAIKVAPVGTLAETYALIPIQAVKPIITPVGVLPETDALVAIQALKVAPVGTLAELETLIAIQAVKPIVTPVGTLAEADALVAIQARKLAAIGTVAELETLIAIQALKVVTVGTLAELESLIAIQAVKPIVTAVGVLAEIDSLIPIAVSQPGGQSIAVGTLAEVEALIAIQAIKTAIIGTLAETETLIAIQARKIVTVGTLAELETLIAIQARKITTVGTLAETETLIAIQARKIVTVGTLAELETLIAIQARKIVTVGTLAELEALIAIQAVKPIVTAVGTLAEIETLIAIGLAVPSVLDIAALAVGRALTRLAIREATTRIATAVPQRAVTLVDPVL